MIDESTITNCTGLHCAWRDKCVLALEKYTAYARLMVPLRENTEEHCPYFVHMREPRR